MMVMLGVAFAFSLVTLYSCDCSLVGTREVKQGLSRFNREYAFMSWVLQSLDWKYSTNLTSDNSRALSDFHVTYSRWMRTWKLWARDIRKDTSIHLGLAPVQNRMLSLMISGVVCDDPEDSRELSMVKSDLIGIYDSGTIQLNETLTLRGEEEVNRFMASVRDPDLLKLIWRSWQNKVGRPARIPFSKMVHLLNKCAKDNGYLDYGMAWRSELEMSDVVQSALQLWNTVHEFYQLLLEHAKRRLAQLYSHSYGPNRNSFSEVLNSTGTGVIPVHLLGSLWGYNWENLRDILLPFPKQTKKDKFKMNPMDVLPMAQKVYTSMGMPSLPREFWEKSIFTKPNSNTAECHGAAYDFSTQDDFRMRVCLNGSSTDLGMVLHEMGHIMYFMAYKDQPMIFRTSPNSAFHEALGDSISDGATNKWCFEKHQPISIEDELNYLMTQALSKVAILPWALNVDLWRYKVFSGEIREVDYNSEWWRMREFYQGIRAPEIKDGDFDPGTKFHVIKAMPYMRVYAFRGTGFKLLDIGSKSGVRIVNSRRLTSFLEAMCHSDEANRAKPLAHCCLIGSKKAGEKIWAMMSKGASIPWQKALKSLSGRDHITAEPLLNYYQVLIDWLRLKSHESK